MSPSLPDAAYIHFVGVHPQFRGNGLARALYQRFFELAAADGRLVVRAVTAPGNTQSIAFAAHDTNVFRVHFTGPAPGGSRGGNMKSVAAGGGM